MAMGRFGRRTIAAALAASCILPQAGAAQDQAAEDAIYRQRIQAYQAAAGSGLERYDPVEAVPGAAGALPMPLGPSGAITAASLQAAEDYAAANRSNAFLVWRAGRIEAARYFGDATAQTPLVSRSLARPVSAIAVGRAIALGKIKSLDQPASDFITEWRSTPKSAIKVRQLLDMTAGLLPQDSRSEAGDVRSRAYLHPRHEDVLVNEYPLTDPPGSTYAYASATSDLVAVLIERATGRRYAEFLSAEVLLPLGALGGEVWINRPGGQAHSACCLLLPADTWLRLGVLLVEDGQWEGRRLLPPGYVAAMRKGTASNPFFGLGVWLTPRHIARRDFFKTPDGTEGVLHSKPFAAPDVFMFDGYSSQVVWIIPSKKLVIVRLGAAPPKSPEWDNTAIPNLILRGLKP